MKLIVTEHWEPKNPVFELRHNKLDVNTRILSTGYVSEENKTEVKNELWRYLKANERNTKKWSQIPHIFRS